MCGKTVDLAFLARQPGMERVTGVEFVPKAVEQFAAANPELRLQPKEGGSGVSNGVLSIDVGDIFDLKAAVPYDRVWDRAAVR